MSADTDAYLAELASIEADSFLREVDPDGQDRSLAVTRNLRRAVQRHRKEVDRIRAEARTEARQELIRERQAEAGFRRLGVPESARVLFGDVDPTDQAAMQARADELAAAGIAWGVPPPPPPPPDPNLAAVAAMQAVSAGGTTMESAGDLKARMLDMKANPDKYSFEQHDKIVREYNRAVDAAARKGTSGALG